MTYIPRTIMIVDNDETLIETLFAFLHSNGYYVIYKTNESQAMEYLRLHHQNIDLIFTNLNMSELGGKGLLHEIHAVSPGIKIVVSSGYERKVMNACESVNIAGCIQKPFKLKPLTKVVRKIMQDSSAFHSKCDSTACVGIRHEGAVKG